MERCPHASPRCPEASHKLGCHVVSHHIFWPASEYTTPLEREFRDLPSNRVPMCKGKETELHDNGEHPPKPTSQVMQFCIDLYNLRKQLGGRHVGTS